MRANCISTPIVLVGNCLTRTESHSKLLGFNHSQINLSWMFVCSAAVAESGDIRVVNAITNTTVSQNEMLFNFVISSLIDNAIKFNKEGGTITLANNPKGRTISINISDDGIGIDNNKLDQLFKPFSRADSAVEFNYEGLGFSLFLNRLIMEYTGGSIAALAEPSGGTRMVVNTPVRVNL